MATPRPRPTLARPIRNQPRTAVPKASYVFGSAASQLQSKGLSPRRIDAVHPVPVIRGASHSGRRGFIGKNLLFTMAGAIAALGIVAALGLGWGDTQITIGNQTIGDAGSLINGVGFSNGVVYPNTANLKFPAGNTALAGNEEAVFMAAATTCTMGSAATNAMHKTSITQTGNGTNAILTVSGQTIAGAAKWTNIGQFSSTQLISDGTNWQIFGSRGN